MKYVILIIIFFICGLIGYCIKNKYAVQHRFLIYIKNFLDFLELNISLYKNDLIIIINNYIIQQNNKNANYNKIFQKNNKTNIFNEELLNIYLNNKLICDNISKFGQMLGKNNIEDEVDKIKKLKIYIEKQIYETKELLNSKGDLYFKLWIGVGVAVVILIW